MKIKKEIIYSLIFTVLLFSFTPSFAQIPDSIPKYGKEDYEAFRISAQQDTFLLEIIEKQISTGDTNAVKIKKLLQTPYESRNTIYGFGDDNINAIIFAYEVSKRIREKFEELNDSLKELNPDTTKTDSLILEIQKRMEDLEQKDK